MRLPGSLSRDAIRTVWNQCRDSTPSTAGAAGVDNLSASVFASRLAEHIAAMREDIRAGVYRFSKLRIAPIQKPTGGYRIIAIPTVRDRLLQRALLAHLENDRRFDASSPISFGFTRGRTLSLAQERALELRQTRPWVLQADIVKFFDRIRRRDVKALGPVIN
jgi:retron-type reverse transcriptase